jgi:LuxR family transcriptional regulator, maltose regulon positive regulatory protein
VGRATTSSVVPSGDVAVTPAPPLRSRSIPTTPGRVLARPQLQRRIRDGVRGRLLLVTGPAGAGKTTAVAEALGDDPGVAWVALDEVDRSPWRLQDRVLAALDVVTAPSLVLPDPTVQPGEALGDVCRQLAGIADDLILVLDDGADALRGASAGLIARLLDRFPTNVHVVVLSRRRPALDVERRRAQGEVAELTPEELAFARDDVASYLNDTWGLDLPEDLVTELARVTLGWPVALRLVAEHLAGASAPIDAARRIATADDPAAGPLVRELLDGLGATDRRLLLDLAVLDPLEPTMCERLSEQPDVADRLARLATLGLLVPVGTTGRAYRHHPLVKPHLLAELRHVPGRETALHEIAAAAFAIRGDRTRAIEHTLAAGDRAQALAWLEELLGNGTGADAASAVRELVGRLTVPTIAGHPRVLRAYIDLVMVEGDRDALEAALTVLQDPSVAVPRRSEALRRTRSYLSRLRGDGVEPLLVHRDRGELDPDTALPLGLGLAAEGRHDAASVAFRRALDDAQRHHEIFREVVILADVAWQRAVAGYLVDADLLARRADELASMLRLDAPPLAALLTGAQISLDRGRVDAAREQAVAVRAVAVERRDLVLRVEAGMLVSRACWAGDDVDGAVRILEETERELRQHMPGGGLLSRLARAHASMRLALDDPHGAMEVLPSITATTEDLPPEDRLIAALVHLELGDPVRAREMVRTLSTEGVGPRLTVHALRIEASALGALGDGDAVRVRTRADRVARANGLFTPLVHRRVPSPGRELRASPPAAADAAAWAEPSAAPIEGMTQRELDVLRRLPSSTNLEIADDLYVSVNTVKTHLKSIYRKLGVPSREAAVERARLLGLL